MSKPTRKRRSITVTVDSTAHKSDWANARLTVNEWASGRPIKSVHITIKTPWDIGAIRAELNAIEKAWRRTMEGVNPI